MIKYLYLNPLHLLKSFLFLFFTLVVSFCFAQIRFSTSVNKKSIHQGELLQVQFNIENASNVESVIPPKFNDFTIKSGPNHQNSMSIVNGSVKQSLSVGFVLQPLSTGNLNIGSATAKAEGKLYYTTPITIQVTKSKPEKIDDNPNSIKNPDILKFLQQTRNIITDNRATMSCIKLSFNVPNKWKEIPSPRLNIAYVFFNNIFNTQLQIGVSPPSDDTDINEQVINKLKKMYPGLATYRKIKVAGKNSLEMIHSFTKKTGVNTIHLNTLTLVFFHKTQLIVFLFDNGKLNKAETTNNNNDLRIVYRNLIKSIKIIN